jgi:c-di-GMP-binding flagellar brake protein YcgR
MAEEKRGISQAIPMTERRRFIRHPLCFPLTYRIVEPGAVKARAAKTAAKISKGKKSTTINISMGGLLFAAKKPVTIGSIIMITMPFQDKTFNVRAKVAHCDKNPETKLYNIGAAFHRLGAAYKVKLIEQLYLISEFRDLRSIELGRDISLERASREWIKRYSDRFRRLYW